mmetsp:Transcript_27652/g.72908  ORF Transcript_27652/g.72908 Transcript_27652/m.72908 type:complete len:275 (+) Transcript_27652:1129-1953(+)
MGEERFSSSFDEGARLGQSAPLPQGGRRNTHENIWATFQRGGLQHGVLFLARGVREPAWIFHRSMRRCSWTSSGASRCTAGRSGARPPGLSSLCTAFSRGPGFLRHEAPSVRRGPSHTPGVALCRIYGDMRVRGHVAKSWVKRAPTSEMAASSPENDFGASSSATDRFWSARLAQHNHRVWALSLKFSPACSAEYNGFELPGIIEHHRVWPHSSDSFVIGHAACWRQAVVHDPKFRRYARDGARLQRTSQETLSMLIFQVLTPADLVGVAVIVV